MAVAPAGHEEESRGTILTSPDLLNEEGALQSPGTSRVSARHPVAGLRRRSAFSSSRPAPIAFRGARDSDERPNTQSCPPPRRRSWRLGKRRRPASRSRPGVELRAYPALRSPRGPRLRIRRVIRIPRPASLAIGAGPGCVFRAAFGPHGPAPAGPGTRLAGRSCRGRGSCQSPRRARPQSEGRRVIGLAVVLIAASNAAVPPAALARGTPSARPILSRGPSFFAA